MISFRMGGPGNEHRNDYDGYRIHHGKRVSERSQSFFVIVSEGIANMMAAASIAITDEKPNMMTGEAIFMPSTAIDVA